jgi:N-acetylneuraminic acid mutarotase
MTRKVGSVVAALSLCIGCGGGSAPGASSDASAISGKCPAGSPRDAGFWKTHGICVATLLPSWLGTPSGARSVDVTTAQQAVAILGRSGDASNGINRLDAALLAAKLNVANGVDGSAIAPVVAAVDAFLATHGAGDWASLAAADRGSVAAWTNALAAFDAGALLPDSFRARAPMPTARWWPAAAVAGGKIYVAGGFDAAGTRLATLEVYDPASDQWTTGAPMPTARAGAAAASVGGRIYVIGGFGPAAFPSSALHTVEAFDPASGQWTARADMPTARGDLGAVAVNGKIYAIGGNPGHPGKVAAVEEYDPATDTWRSRTPMPIRPRAAFASAAIGGTIYVAGGVDDVDSIAANVDAYDVAADAWAARSPMPQARFALAGAEVNGSLYAFSGLSGLGLTAPTQRYDPAADAWTTHVALAVPRTRYAAATVGTEIYVLGGQSGSALQTTLDSVEEYTPPF